MAKHSSMAVGLILLSIGSLAAAEGEESSGARAWVLKATPQYSANVYKNSATRDSMKSYGLFLDASYLEQGGFTLGATKTVLDMKANIATIHQKNAFVSGRYSLTPDALPGRVTLRADYHYANNDAPGNEIDDVKVIQPQISYLNFNKTFYVDVPFAYSYYGDSELGRGTLRVSQWSPALGVGVGNNWFQLRYYGINMSRMRSQEETHTSALEMKWTYYSTAGGLMPNQLQLSALSGERLYAVDSEGAGIYNLSDVQTGGASIGGVWDLSSQVTLMSYLGQENFDAGIGAAKTNYASRYWYMALQFKW